MSKLKELFKDYDRYIDFYEKKVYFFSNTYTVLPIITRKGILMENIKVILNSLAEEKYRDFQYKLVPNAKNILGVRVPMLRKIAKDIAKKDWKSFLENNNKETYEELMLEGYVIGYAKMDIEEALSYLEKFIPYIDNWAICDSSINSFKFTGKNEKRVLEFIKPYLKSEKEFEVRFAVIMLLTFYIKNEYIDEILEIMGEISNRAYYVQMAVAWTVSVCYVKFPEKTEKFLLKNSLDDFTHNKSIQKIGESFRVENKDKIRLKKLWR